MYLFEFRVCFLLRLTNIITVCDTHQYPPAIGYQLAVFDSRAHMQYQPVKRVRTAYLCAFGIGTRIPF